jgi:hypothetical protein
LLRTRLLENLVQVALALANPHVEHVGNAHGDEAGLHFTRRRARQVRLAAARRAVHQNAAAGLLAIGLVNLRVRQRVNDLEADLFFDVLHASDVGKADTRAARSP